MYVRHARAFVAISSALAASFLVVSRVESLASGASTRPDTRGSCRISLHVRDPEGRPLTARVRVTPASWRERLRLSQIDDLRGVVEGGELTLTVPRGSYRVFVSRGPEWSLVEFPVAATPNARSESTVELAHEVSLAGWRGADLHVHTHSSRDAEAHGGVTASDLRAEGVDLVAITDHNHIGALDGFDSIGGAEVTTWAPEIGHFNAFPLRELPRWSGTNPVALLKELTRDPRVFVQINHPRLDDHIAYFKLGGFDGTAFAQPDFHLNAQGLEVWNGYDLARPERVFALLAEWRSCLARGERITATGGSDSHGAPSHPPGYPRTYTRAASASQLAPELREGRAFVTNGPLLELSVNGRGPGESVITSNEPRVQIEMRVLAPSWMRVDTLELWTDDKLAWSTAIPPAAPGSPLAYETQLEVSVASARVIAAVAHGGSGLDRLLGRSGIEPLAFTNAVHLTNVTLARR
jgi:hypothetical protein